MLVSPLEVFLSIMCGVSGRVFVCLQDLAVKDLILEAYHKGQQVCYNNTFVVPLLYVCIIMYVITTDGL